MLTLSLESMLWAAATFVYLVVIGGLLLKRAANKDDARITQPFISMAQVAFISGIVFALASVPSYVARIVNPNVLPFIMPYAPILFAISFVVFIKKLDSKRSGCIDYIQHLSGADCPARNAITIADTLRLAVKGVVEVMSLMPVGMTQECYTPVLGLKHMQ